VALNSGSEIPAGVRTATVSALNYLELARVGHADFIEMLRRFPVLRRRTVEQSLRSLRSDSEVNPLMADYVEQGLYEGQSILVLDMDLCIISSRFRVAPAPIRIACRVVRSIRFIAANICKL
jgi:hypothetical protein